MKFRVKYIPELAGLQGKPWHVIAHSFNRYGDDPVIYTIVSSHDSERQAQNAKGREEERYRANLDAAYANYVTVELSRLWRWMTG